jgi:hypothetical protein
VVTGVTLVLWILVAAGVVLYASFFFIQLYPRLVESWQLGADAAVEGSGIEPDNLRAATHWYRLVARFMMAGAVILAGLLGLAAISTLLCITTSRRATLRQIQASLAEISEQLRSISRE